MRLLLLAMSVVLLGGCQMPAPMPTADHVDLPRFMGSWYVIAHVPARVERDAYGAVETYRLETDGTIDTTYTFRRGSLDGPVKTMRARGFVRNTETNADWGMQFIWPFRAEYLITHVDDDYQHTIVTRTKRDMAWIMARTPTIPEDELRALLDRLVELGYSEQSVRLVPQVSGSER